LELFFIWGGMYLNLNQRNLFKFIKIHKSFRPKNKKLYIIISFLATILILLYFFNFSNSSSTFSSHNNSTNNSLIHFIDVGQGDSILIQVNNKNILIDGGPNSSERKLETYLKKHKVKKIDFFIVTHPHEDHIGGGDNILKKFNINYIYSPQIMSNNKDFIDLVAEIKKQNKKINIASEGVIIELGEEAYLKFFSPEKKNYDNINNSSVVIKFTFRNTSFLFTGDSEKLIEDTLLSKDYALSSDVIKVAHHGSKTSSSKLFLSKVNPKYAVISCGIGNDYGHPDKLVLNRLKEMNIQIFRTDKDGHIIFYTDGNSLSISKEK
jgi:competence protein ComEC